ncbi:MAG: hypothetical protein ACPGO3_03845 [Magnetospiraceae bacterium]
MKYPLLAIGLTILIAAGIAGNAVADDCPPKFGLAGLLSNKNKETLPEIVLGSGLDLSATPLTLRSGGYYVLPIKSDGSAELGLEGPGFFRAVWMDEVVINDLEVRPFGMESVEFDDAGVIELKFVAVKPGRYELRIPGSRGESQRVPITIQ